MPKRIVDGTTTEGMKYPIQPNNIKIDEHYFDAFGNTETEVSARLIVKFCQELGGWAPFTRDQIDARFKLSFSFWKLCDCSYPGDNRNYVILGDDGNYRVTHEFITNCFKSAPAI